MTRKSPDGNSVVDSNDDESKNEVLNDIFNFQPIALVGANLSYVEELLDVFCSSKGGCDFVVIHISTEKLLAQFETGCVSVTECFFAEFFAELEATTSIKCDEKILQAQKLYDEPSERFTHVLQRCRRELGRDILLVLDGYEHLLELPRKERQLVIGGPLFELCEHSSDYKTALVLVSRCPIWWCEYDEPPFSSVVFERVARYRVGDDSLLTPEEQALHLPDEQRIDFMRIVRMRTNA